MAGITEHVVTDLEQVNGEAPRARDHQRGRLADLPRLIIPEIIVKPRPLPAPGSNDVDVQPEMQDEKHVFMEDQRSRTVLAVGAEIRGPIFVGPRPLQKIDIPKSSSYVSSSVMSTSAPATQTAYRVTTIAVSPPQDDRVWSSSPLASSVMFPVSRNPSEFAKTTVSDARSTPGRVPARYQDLNTDNRLSLRIPDNLLLPQPPGRRESTPAIPPALPITFGSVASGGHPHGNGKSASGHAYDATPFGERRRASTIRTSIVPLTASSLSTFEIVQLPQLPSRAPRVSET
jgi:hypothetical protein